MTVADLRVAIQPALREILTAEELASTSITVTDSAALIALDDESASSGSTELQVVTMGENATIWLDAAEGPDEVHAEVRSDLQDFVAESRCGWGRLHP